MEYKYLGVVLDDGLTWKTHVDYIYAKVGKRLGLLRRIREDLTANATNLIYKSFIYCQIWIIVIRFGPVAIEVTLIV